MIAMLIGIFFCDGCLIYNQAEKEESHTRKITNLNNKIDSLRNELNPISNKQDTLNDNIKEVIDSQKTSKDEGEFQRKDLKETIDKEFDEMKSLVGIKPPKKHKLLTNYVEALKAKHELEIDSIFYSTLGTATEVIIHGSKSCTITLNRLIENDQKYPSSPKDRKMNLLIYESLEKNIRCD